MFIQVLEKRNSFPSISHIPQLIIKETKTFRLLGAYIEFFIQIISRKYFAYCFVVFQFLFSFYSQFRVVFLGKSLANYSSFGSIRAK